MKPGRYVLEFEAGAYFRAKGVALPDPPFLDVVRHRLRHRRRRGALSLCVAGIAVRLLYLSRQLSDARHGPLPARRPTARDSEPDPTQTVLRWLRVERRRTGTKEGCAEGDCGACTVVLGEELGGKTVYRAVNACILFLPLLDGKTLFTVESLSVPDAALHPCSRPWSMPMLRNAVSARQGFVMSLYAHYLNRGEVGTAAIQDALAGNLCRCTGYGPIVEAASRLNDAPRVEPQSQSAPSGAESLTIVHGAKQLFAPHTRDELAALYLRYPDATLLAGGTDVGLWVTKRLEVLPTVISVNSVAGLRRISQTPDTLEIGAAVTYTQAYAVLAELHPDFANCSVASARSRCATPAQSAATLPTARRLATARRR